MDEWRNNSGRGSGTEGGTKVIALHCVEGMCVFLYVQCCLYNSFMNVFQVLVHADSFRFLSFFRYSCLFNQVTSVVPCTFQDPFASFKKKL